MEPTNEGEHSGVGATATSSRPRKPIPWWQTLPGLITAFAALITAVTGLVAVLHSGGSSPQSEGTVAHDRPDSPPASIPASTSSTSTASNSSAPAGVITLPLPTPSEVRIANGGATIRILSMRLEPYNAKARSLVIEVRYTNNGSYPANFWGRSFRLVADEVPREPTRDLNEVVASHAAKEGSVVFEVPIGLASAALRVIYGDEQTDVPLDLAPRR